MEDYGYYSQRSRERRTRQGGGGLALRVADGVMAVVTAVCSLLLIGAMAARFVSPERMWWPALLGLIFPVLYAAGIVCCLWWVVRWKRVAIAVAVLLLFGLKPAGAYWQPDLRKHYGEEAPSKSDIVVMSYNVKGFDKQFATEEKTTRQLIADLANDNCVDILCCQEFAGDVSDPEIRPMLPDLPYFRVVPYDCDSERTVYGGLAVFSRYPIVGWKALPARDEDRLFSMWADVKIGRDTVRVFNNHLNSTYLGSSDVDYLSSFRFVSAEGRKARVGDIVRKLRDSYRKRAPQAEAIAEAIAESPYPVIVCGDFNDTPASYAYRTVRGKRLRDSFITKGRGLQGTYDGFFNMFRIDYILTDREGIEVLGYYPFDVLYSDHMPVAAAVALTGADA